MPGTTSAESARQPFATGWAQGASVGSCTSRSGVPARACSRRRGNCTGAVSWSRELRRARGEAATTASWEQRSRARPPKGRRCQARRGLRLTSDSDGESAQQWATVFQARALLNDARLGVRLRQGGLLTMIEDLLAVVEQVRSTYRSERT